MVCTSNHCVIFIPFHWITRGFDSMVLLAFQCVAVYSWFCVYMCVFACGLKCSFCFPSRIVVALSMWCSLCIYGSWYCVDFARILIHVVCVCTVYVCMCILNTPNWIRTHTRKTISRSPLTHTLESRSAASTSYYIIHNIPSDKKKKEPVFRCVSAAFYALPSANAIRCTSSTFVLISDSQHKYIHICIYRCVR